MQKGRSSVSVAELVRGGFLSADQKLTYRNSTITAKVTADGDILFNGTSFSSPSTAAQMAAGGTSTNGWLAWFADIQGERVHLASLRAELIEERQR